MADEQPTEGVPRRKKPRKVALPPSAAPPELDALRAKAHTLVASGGEKELFTKLREDLMVNYLLEVQAGQDLEVNPQHSRASRKQAKEIAELLIQLSSRGS